MLLFLELFLLSDRNLGQLHTASCMQCQRESGIVRRLNLLALEKDVKIQSSVGLVCGR